MRVMCIASYFIGEGGPPIAFGTTLTIRRKTHIGGKLYYEFREYPLWGYEAYGFIRLSNIDGVEVLRQQRKREDRLRKTLQIALAFTLFICWYRLC